MSQEILERLNTNWKGKLLENKEALKLLNERGIDQAGKFNELELGYADIPSPNSLPERILKFLTSFGIQNHELIGMTSLPLRTKDNRIVNFFFLGKQSEDDRLIRKGGIINIKAFTVFKSLVVVGTVTDFFAYYQSVKENVIPVIQSDWMIEEFTRTLSASKVEELVFINECPYWELIKPKIKDLNIKVYEIKLPENKAVADYLQEHSAARLSGYIEGEKAKALKQEKESSGEAEARFEVIEEPGMICFKGADRSYRVRGFNRDGFDKHIELTLEMADRSFPDRVDISRSQGRSRYANFAAGEFEMSVETVRDDLGFIYKTLDKMQEERYKMKTGQHEKNAHIVTPEDMKKAIDILKTRDLLTDILLKDTEKMGFVGEEINKQLFYIAATSRLTGKPLSVLDISPPGTGKSFGLSSIMELMPPDELLKYSRLTPHALYYKNEEELKGKVLYIEEIVGMEESLEPIRMIISAEELAVSFVEKDPRTGQLKTVERRVKVSIPIISSGVRDIFDEETLSRFILTYNDVTSKHTEMVLKAQAMKYTLEGEKTQLYRNRYLKRHRDFQKTFDVNIVVANEHAKRVMLNKSMHIVTRKQEQYLRLMYNIAFIRQHLKKKRKDVDRNGNGITVIDVDREDIILANTIANQMFQFSRGDLTKRLHDAYQTIIDYCTQQIKEKRIGLYEFKFSRREIREYAGWEHTTARRIFDELEALEYIRRVRGDKQGMQYLYQLVPYTERSRRNGDLQLLDPDKL